MTKLDAIDTGIIGKLSALRDKIAGPRVGDYVRFPCGKLERFSYNWGDGLQTSPGGSFHLCSNGKASFSGGLNPSTPRDNLTLTDEMKPGGFWIFHHDIAGAFRGVDFDLPCRVFETTATYEGFIK